MRLFLGADYLCMIYGGNGSESLESDTNYYLLLYFVMSFIISIASLTLYLSI